MILILPFAAILFGCATVKGPLYSDVEKSEVLQPAPGKGLIFVYSHNLPLGKTFYVWANGKCVSSMMSYNRFFYFQADPGELRLASKSHKASMVGAAPVWVDSFKTEKVALTVLPGGIYYVDMHNGFARETMSLVSKEEGERQIQTCYFAPETSP